MKRCFVGLSLLAFGTLSCGVDVHDEIDQQEQAFFDEPTDTSPRVPSAQSVLYHAEAVIDAPIEVVWNAFVDLPNYSQWNPFVIQAEGTVAPGGKVHVTVMLGPLRQPSDHVVMTVEPNKTFCWRDAGWNSRFVYAQRCRWLSLREDGQVAYKQTLQLDPNADGLNLTGAAHHFNGRALQTGVENEARALKTYAESRVP